MEGPSSRSGKEEGIPGKKLFRLLENVGQCSAGLLQKTDFL